MKRGTLITADSLRSLMRLEFTGDYLFLPAFGQFRLTDGAQTGPQLVVWFKFQCEQRPPGAKADSIAPARDFKLFETIFVIGPKSTSSEVLVFAGSFGARNGMTKICLA
jgi:hypothetical protein